MNFLLFDREIVDGLLERISEKVYLKTEYNKKHTELPSR